MGEIAVGAEFEDEVDVEGFDDEPVELDGVWVGEVGFDFEGVDETAEVELDNLSGD